MTTLLLLPPYFNTTTTTTTTLFLIFFFHCYLSAAISVVDQAPPVMTTPAGSQLIPAFPEQADVNARCPLSLSDEHFNGIKSACGDKKDKVDPILHRSRCCPVLAAWLYSAYSATALGLGLGHSNYSHTTTNSYGYDDNNMPLLPDDSETCESSDLGKALKDRGIELVQPNETCDMVYCYCGIRLHPFTCPESFSVTTTTGRRNLVPHQTVQTLETNCLTGVGGCNKCLHSLFLLVNKAAAGSSSNSTKLLLSEEERRRKKKIHKKDCELMGLTWLLAKNRKAYIHTVTQVLRALMLTRDDDDASASASDPISCTLNSDGMPLAVDSSEIMYDHNSSSSSTSTIIINFQPQPKLLLVLLLLMHFILSTIN